MGNIQIHCIEDGGGVCFRTEEAFKIVDMTSKMQGGLLEALKL